VVHIPYTRPLLLNYSHLHREVRLASWPMEYLCGDSDDTASRSSTRVSSLLAVLVAALSEIVGAAVNDNGATEDTLGSNQLDQLVGLGALGVALSVGFEVAQVTDVALLILRCTVGLGVRVEMRAGTRAAVGVVTKLVNVEGTLGIGVVTGNVPADGGLGGFGALLEGDSALYGGVPTEDGDGLDHFGG